MHHGDPARARLVEPCDAVEHRGLAGAVRADQRGDVAARHGEADVVDRHQAAEAHGEMLDGEHGLPHPCPSFTSEAGMSLRSPSAIEGLRVEIRPRGRHTMIATIDRPNSTMRY